MAFRDTTTAPGPRTARDFVPHGIIVLLAALMFVPSLGGGFLNWDDDRFIVDNPHVNRLTVDNLVHAFSGLRFESYQPLHLVSYMIDGSLWPDTPFCYRLHNLALFCVALLLLYEWFRRLRFVPLACTVATLFFALAPYRVESVAWIACRKDVLMLVFLLAAWHLHLMASGARHKALLRLGATLLFAAALLSKSSALVFPAMVFVVDTALRGKSPLAALRGAAPYLPFAIALGAALPFIWSHAELLRQGDTPTLFGRLTLVGWTLYHYGATVLFPFALSPLYASPSDAEIHRGVVFSASVAIIAGAAIASSVRKGISVFKPLGIAALALLPLLPFLNFFPMYYLVSDRYLLLPSIGLAAAAAVLVERGISKRRRGAVIFVSAVVLGAMGIGGAAEASHWTTSEALWSHAVQREPDAYYARLKYGETLRVMGKPARSMVQYREAQRLRPLSPLSLGGIFWAAVLQDMASGAKGALPPPEKLVSDFLSIANDGQKLRRFARALEAQELHRAAAVVKERIGH